MLRWVALLLPCVPVIVAPAACTGTESGNPRCAPSPCPVEVLLERSGAPETTRVQLEGRRSPVVLTLDDRGTCGGSLRGEVWWSSEDATRTATGTLHVAFDRSGSPEVGRSPAWAGFESYEVLAADLLITAEPRVAGEILLVARPDAGTSHPPERIQIDGQLDVSCREGEPGVALPTADGDVVVVRCNYARREVLPCGDTPSGC